jgi:hypothetical protein
MRQDKTINLKKKQKRTVGSYKQRIVLYEPFEELIRLPKLNIQTVRTECAVYDSRLIEKDINGVEYTYENHSELAFGTSYEE